MKTMKNIDSFTHVRGESLFVDDVITRKDTLYGLVFDSPKAHEKIKSVDYTKAEAFEGVEKIFTYKDILGENQIGGIIPDEPLWAEGEVHFWGSLLLLLLQKAKLLRKKHVN